MDYFTSMLSPSNFSPSFKEDPSLLRLPVRGDAPLADGAVLPTIYQQFKEITREISQNFPHPEATERTFPSIPHAPSAPRKKLALQRTEATGESPIKNPLSRFITSHPASPDDATSLVASLNDEGERLCQSVLGVSSPSFIKEKGLIRSLSCEELTQNAVRRLVWDDKFKQLSKDAKKVKEDLFAYRLTIPNDNVFMRLLERIPGLIYLILLLGIDLPTRATEKIAHDLMNMLNYEFSNALEQNKVASRHEIAKIFHLLTKNSHLKNVLKKILEDSTIKKTFTCFIEKYTTLLTEELKNPDSTLSTQMLAYDLEKLHALADPGLKEKIKEAIHQALENGKDSFSQAPEALQLQKEFAALDREDPLRERLGVLHELLLTTESYLKKINIHLSFLDIRGFVECFQGEHQKILTDFIKEYKEHQNEMKDFFEGLLLSIQSAHSADPYDEKISRVINNQFNKQRIKKMIVSAQPLILYAEYIDKLVTQYYGKIEAWWQNYPYLNRQKYIHEPLKEVVELKRGILDFGFLSFQRILKFPLFLSRFADEYMRENKKLWVQILAVSKNFEKESSLFSSLEDFQNEELWKDILEEAPHSLLVTELQLLREPFAKNVQMWSTLSQANEFFDKKIKSLQEKMKETVKIPSPR